MDKNIATLSELIEHSAEVTKLLISNGIDMENGDIASAQKNIKDATNLLSVMLKDIFVEAAAILNVNTDEEDDYDFSTLDIAKLLTSVIYNAGNLIGLYVENKKDAVTKAVETKLTKSINATRSLANTLFFN